MTELGLFLRMSLSSAGLCEDRIYPMLIHYKLIATGSLIEKQRVHYSQFVGIRRKLPSLEERKHLSKIFQALNAKITNAESMEHQLIKLRTSLLQQLFI